MPALSTEQAKQFMTELLAIWTQTDPRSRREAIGTHYHDDVVFHDPDGVFTGHAGIESFSDSLQRRFPGQLFEMVGDPSIVGDALRTYWRFGPSAGWTSRSWPTTRSRRFTHSWKDPPEPRRAASSPEVSTRAVCGSCVRLQAHAPQLADVTSNSWTAAVPKGPPAKAVEETSPVYAFLLTTAVLFAAELGDKSQLMAMTFAARYRARDVLIGITAATALVHLASVGIGYFIGDTFAGNQHWISIVAGVAFLGFAAWTLRGDELTDEETDKARTSQGAAVLAVGVARVTPATASPERSGGLSLTRGRKEC
jgi:Uncharacterized protein family UPF0016/SnoaL-like domain